jgi:NAD-dependent DNA ligase
LKDEFKLERIEDLYSISDVQWVQLEKREGFGKTSINKIKVEIEKSKKIPILNLISGLNIPLIGKSSLNEIFEIF